MVPLALVLIGLVGATMVRGQADRAAMAERDLRYQADARTIDDARQAEAAREQARRSASMQ